MAEDEKTNLKLELGDIISIEAPDNDTIHNHVFFIDYIDENTIRIINTNTLDTQYLNIESGQLTDKSIQSISILSRESEKGYARQNGLVPKTWVEMKIGGDIPVIFVAEITDLQEDMIEMTTYPDKDVLYIDFAYKGIPLDIPIEQLTIRDKPESEPSTIKETDEDSVSVSESDASETKKPTIELELPKDEIAIQLKEVFEEADNIVFGSVEKISQEVYVSEDEKRYSLDEQTNDLLDEMLSTIPNVERTSKVLGNIRLMIERFTQLRKMYSTYDKNGVIKGMLRKTSSYKPLVESLKKLQHNLYWLMPIVKNKKQILDVIEPEANEEILLSLNEDVIPSNTESFVVNMNEAIEKYKTSGYATSNNYSSFMSDILRQLGTYEEPEQSNIISNVSSQTSINVVIDNVLQNLQDFYSSVYKNDKISKQRFVISKYNLGITMLKADEMRGSYMKSHKVKLTQNEKVPIKGFMILPQSYVLLSKINLPGTTIYDKSNLNHVGVNYWNFLKKQASVVKHSVDNMDTRIDYSGKNFIDKIKAFVLNEDFMNSTDENVKQRTYEKFLEIFIPTTHDLFNSYKAYLKNGVSIDTIIRQMEPFLVYRDDLSFKQYSEMRDFIEENLMKLKQQLTFNSKDTNLIRNLKTKMVFANGMLTSLMDIKKNTFINDYQIQNETGNLDGDVYSKMMNTDYGNLYNVLIQDLTKDLYVDIDIDKTLKTTIADLEQRISTQDAEKETSGDNCNTRELVKTYFSMEDLNEDDGTDEVYYDKKYDQTRYEFIEEYRAEQEILEPKEFNELLVIKLKEIVGMTDEQAKAEAQALIDGRRKIQNGNYAVFINEDGEKFYYKREENKWTLDQTINPNENVDDSTLFCNTSSKCLKIKEECLSVEDSKERLMKQTVENMANAITDDSTQYVEGLQKRIENYTTILGDIIALRRVLLIRNNNKFYKYGLDVSEEGTVISPYTELAQIILGQRDFTKKMLDINRFINAFTRNYDSENEDESPYWYYCNKTNTKLLPTFFGKLSSAYIHKEDFLYVLDQICAEQGEISDDGDKWVDKHSGYTIRMIELSTDEGYDESGYATTTKATLDNIEESILQDKPLLGDELYNTKEALIINNIINALGLYTGIDLKDKEIIVKGVLVNAMKQVGSKDRYEKTVKAAALKGKKMISYEQKRNQFFLFFSGLYFLVFLQTSIPSVRTRKTFPGCVKSFSGFPLEDNGDTSGLKYVACIMKKIASSQTPWNAIKSISESSLIKNMEIIYNKVLISDSIIAQRIVDKQESIESGEDFEFIPEDLDVSKWDTFLPPLKPLNLSDPTNISSDLKSKLMTSVNKGSYKQIPILSMIKSKILYFSLGIQKEIEKIVNKDEALLQTTSGVPFIENMCCHNDIHKNALNYFTDKSKNILSYNTIINELRELYNQTIYIAKSAILVDIRDTKLKYPQVNNEFGEKTIYQGFINFCKINKDEVLDDSLKVYCHDQTSAFDGFDSLDEKIKILKREGKDYNNDMFIELLNAVNKQRVLSMNFEEVIPKTHERLLYIVNHLKSKLDAETANVSPSLVNLIEKVLSIVGIYRKEIHEDSKKLTNYLIVATNSMKRNIISYISDYSNFKRREKKQIIEFLNNVESFERIKKSSILSKEEVSDLKVISYLQNCIYHMVYEYPNIILNKVDYSNIAVHKHWKVSDKHKADIKALVRKNYDSLKQYYGNPDLKPLLLEIQELTDDIIKLMKHTPFIKNKRDGSSDVFNNNLVKQLYIYYFFSIFEKHIELENLVMDEEYAVLQEEIDLGMEYADEEEPELREKQQRIAVLEGNKVQVQKILASLIGSYAMIFKRQKERINLNRALVLELVLRSKEKEKDVKTRQLKELTDEERKVDSELRKAKLGQWNVGLQKGLTQYVKNFYDVERTEMEQEAILESKLGNISDVTNMNRDIYVMDFIEQEMTDLQIEQEAFDMSMFAEDDDFGDRDGDEQF